MNKCSCCGKSPAIGYSVAAYLTERSNSIYFCENDKCSSLISDLCKYVNIMNRRLISGPLHPGVKGRKATKTRKATEHIDSECRIIYKKYKQRYVSGMDDEAFPPPSHFEGMGINEI